MYGPNFASTLGTGETSGGESTAGDSLPEPAEVSGDTEIHRAHYLTQRCLSQIIKHNISIFRAILLRPLAPQNDPMQQPLCVQWIVGIGMVPLPIKRAIHRPMQLCETVQGV